MITFFVAIAVLLLVYFTYGKLVEKIFQIDPARQTPAVVHPDGVDFVPMKTWRIFLIQLLNIAGLGPIYGALAGAAWGPRVYLWIVFGTILGGGIHDFLSGMMSLRNDGTSVAEITHTYLGKLVGNIMRVFTFVLLFLIGVNFSLGPAALLAMLTPSYLSTTVWLIIILVYYFFATFLPIDKIIGPIYPIFGIVLIIMAVGVGGGLIIKGYPMQELWHADVFATPHPNGAPVWAMMFVTVACGAVSGFHSTQSPIMARCLTNEREGRKVFYGAMVAEGIIALIWAAAGVSFYRVVNGQTLGYAEGIAGLAQALASRGQGGVVYDICKELLGPVGLIFAMLGVIACPITSGDTALRSARLTLADWFKIDQSSVRVRLLISLPMLILVAIVGRLPFQVVWRYFSWSNQTLAAIGLWAGAAYLYRNGFPPLACFIAVCPATFMTAVSGTYIMQAPEGFRLPTSAAYPIGLVIAAVCLCLFVWRILIKQKDMVQRVPLNVA